MKLSLIPILLAGSLSATLSFAITLEDTADNKCKVFKDGELYEIRNQSCEITLNDLTNNGLRWSDLALKSHINPLSNEIMAVTSINTYHYQLNGPKYGVMAQELEEIYPDLVETTSSGLKRVDYIGLSTLTLQALKEANEKIKQLERRIESIEQSN
ncbi:tail fiber domain-containing protein [Spartinivicinus ruber]|uniref:tail fiber domain-containing protein n=1 Tax=Spartinivicinus ruber TaxID=2683272 RepID=UPI0013D69528|nr:tail fiber domain-containing protein [Spartinivicinus ruber]